MLGVLVLLTTGLSVPAATGVAATTLYVNGSYANSTGCTAASPCQTITDALSVATIDTSVTTITIAGANNAGGKTFAGTYCEQIVVDNSLTLEASDAAQPPVIDGGHGSSHCAAGMPQQSVVTVGDSSSASVTVTLQGVTIQNGDASNNPEDQYGYDRPGLGGGIFAYPGVHLSLIHTNVRDNIACNLYGPCYSAGEGGGIYAQSGTLTLANSTVSDNTACIGTSCLGYGGGIVKFGALTLTGSAVSANTDCSGSSCSAEGGGIYSDDYFGNTYLGGTVALTDSAVSGNIGCVGNTSGGLCSGLGGGIYNDSATVTLTNSMVTGNVACNRWCDGEGGGIWNANTMTLSDSTVDGNTGCTDSPPCTGAGGGIYNEETSNQLTGEYFGTVALDDSTVSGNSACSSSACSTYTGEGGGIYNSSAATVAMTSSTASGNIACGGCTGTGGGIYNYTGGAVALTNSVVAMNGGASASPDCSGSVGDGKPDGTHSVGHNLVSDGMGCTTSALADHDQIGPSSGISANLGAPGSFGGATQTVPLMYGSTAIAAGDATACQMGTLTVAAPHGGTATAPGPNGLDQRGYHRHTSVCDIGAFETGARPDLADLPASGPGITNTSPNSLPATTSGFTLTIDGQNFGTSQGTGSVSFAATGVTVLSWTNTTITATVPGSALRAAKVGEVSVTDGGGATSNRLPFYVTPAATTVGAYTSNAVQGIASVLSLIQI